MTESPSSITMLESLPKSDSGIYAYMRSLSQKFSIAVILIGTVVILGWMFDIPLLKSVLPGLPLMKVNTATCFILSGSSLWLWHQHSRRQNLKSKVVQFLIFNFAFLIILIASLTLIEYGFNLNLRIDQLLMQQSEPVGSLAVPGRMAPNTAGTFLVVGAALLLMGNPRSQVETIQGLAITAWLVSFIGLLGHVYGSVYFYTAGSYTGMALHTAIAFQLLSVGILCALPDRGLMLLITAHSVGSLMFRRLLPLAIALPVLVNGLTSLGYRLNLYGNEIADALSSTLEILIFAGIAGWNARSLNQIDLKRREASDLLQQYADDTEDLYNNAPYGYHSLDTNGMIVRINNTELNWLGYSREELLNQKKITELLTPASLQIFQANFPRFKQQGYINNLEFEFVRKDGSILWVSLNGTAIKDTAGTYIMSRSTLFDISERKQAEASLAQLAAIVEYSGDAIVSKTLDGMILSWNKSAEKIFGYQSAEMIGQSITRIIPPDLTEEEQHILKTVRQGETIDQYETVRLRKDGQRIDISITVAPLKDATGRIIGASATKRDISDRKRAEEALRLSEERLQLALEASGDGLWDWNIATGQIYYSPQYMKMLGYEVGELPDNVETWEDLIHPDDQSWVLNILNAHLQNNSTPYSFDYRLRTKPGGWKWVANYGKVVARDNKGHPLRMIGTHRDVNDRKQAEQQLELQAVITRNMAEGICLVRADNGMIVYANPKFEQMFGYEAGELNDRHVSIVNYATDPEEAEAVNQAIRTAILQNGEATYNVHNVKKNGTSFWCSATTSVFNHPNYGDVLVAVQQDITDRKQAEEQIAASLKEKEVLLKEIHHRVKNNLGIVSGLLQMQVRRARDSASRAILQDSQNRIASIALVHEKLYRSENFANIDFSQYLQDLTIYLFDSYNVSSNQITLDVQVESISLEIETAIPCGLIVNELVSNALKHAFPGSRTGKIQVRLAPSDTPIGDGQPHRLFTLVVQDNGVGFPNDFDLDSTQTLGISLVQGLVAQIRGALEINDQHGTEVKVTFRESSV